MHPDLYRALFHRGNFQCSKQIFRYLLSAKGLERIDYTLFFRTWSFTLTWFQNFLVEGVYCIRKLPPFVSIVVQFNRLCCKYCSSRIRGHVSYQFIVFQLQIHYCLLYENGVQLLSHVQLFAIPWTAALQAPVSFTLSQSLLKLTSILLRCHPTISFSVAPFSSCPQSFPASGSFPVSQFFSSSGQSIGASASSSVLPLNIQD